MKTKHILTAMVLPAMLAACTADEIVENNNNVAANRADVPAVSFKAEGLESRLTYNDVNMMWDWEKTDKFLLLQADNGYNNVSATALPGQRFSAGAPSTGYEYTKNENGGYSTSAAVMEEGLYWGYAPSFDKKYKGYVKFELPTAQYMHVKGQEDTYSNEELAALITPLYEVSALNEGDQYNKLPLEMINFYSTLVMPLKNNTEEDIAINQIVFEADEALTVAGRISTDAMKNYVVASNGEEWAPAVNFDTDADNDYESIPDMLDDMRETYLACTYSKDAGDKQSKVIVLNLGGYVLKAGKTEEFYMLVPASGKEIDYSITIVAEEGLVKINSSYASNSMQETTINHNAKKAAFGRTNAGAARSFVIDEGDFTPITGAHYVTNAKEMMRILDEDVNGTIKVYNVGDWGIDASLAKAIKNSDVFVTFLNDIEIEGAALTAEKALELTKVAFDKEVTVKGNTKVDFNLGKYKATVGGTATLASVEKLAIEEGAVVTLTSGDFEKVANKGNLSVAANANVITEQIDTYGALTLTDYAPVVNVKAGSVTYATAQTNGWALTNEDLTLPTLSATNMVNATITINSNVKMTLAESMILDKYTVSGTTTTYAVKLVNNGEIVVNKDLTVNGEFENAENAEVSGSATLAIYGSAKNDGLVNPDYLGVYAGATLKNNGTWYADIVSRNEGTVTLGENSKTRFNEARANEGERLINNDAKSKNLVLVDNALENMTVYYTFTTAVNSADVNALDCEKYRLNKIIFNEKLTINVDEDNAVSNSNGITGLSGIKTLQFAKGLEIEADVKNQGINKNIANIIINGSDVKFKGSNWLGAEGVTVCALGINGATTITVNKNCKLTVDDMTLCPVGTDAKLTFKSIDKETSGETDGAVENNGKIYTGKNGTVYNSTANTWWTGAAAVKGYYDTTAGSIK